jgi:hypothetical protein
LDRSADLALSSESLLPPLASNSLRLLEFCINSEPSLGLTCKNRAEILVLSQLSA